MDYIARHYNMDLALVWTLRLEEKTDQGKIQRAWLGDSHMGSVEL